MVKSFFRKKLIVLITLIAVLVCLNMDIFANETNNSTITGFVWADKNNDGIMNSNESKISNAKVLLFDAKNKKESVKEVKTNSNGKYTFNQLKEGTYIIGINKQAISEVEYLIPMKAIQKGNDNKFDADFSNEPFLSYSETIKIENNDIKEDINAGMRFDIKIAPLSGNYTVNEGMTIGTFTTLQQAVNSCSSNCVITANINDSNLGAVVSIPANLKVKLTSSTTAKTIYQLANERHITLANNSELTLENIILEGSGLTSGTSYNGGINVESHAKLIVGENAIIQKCYAVDGGGVYSNLGIIDINKGLITNNIATVDGGGIRATSSAVNITNGTLSLNKAPNGAGISANSASSVEMTQGNITNNTNANRGGGVNIDGGTIFVMNSGIISENEANDGGAIIAGSSSDIIINGGTINANEANNNGGAVYLENYSELNVGTGAIISENITANDGGGIFANSDCPIILGGATISNNIATNGIAGGIRSQNSTLTMNDTILSGNEALKSDGGAIRATDTKITMTGVNINNNKAAHGAGVSTNGSTAKIDFYSGSITKNIATGRGGGVNIDGGVVFTLYTGTVSQNTAKDGAGVIVDKSTFVLKDGQIKENDVIDDGGGFKLESNSTLTIEKGDIIDNESGRDGGAIRSSNSIINITTVEITGNLAPFGAGISANGASTISMSDGNISGNVSHDRGGGVNIDDGTTFTMLDGVINNNQAQYGGGIIATKNSIINITTGQINDNMVSRNGGGVHLSSDSNLSLNGGSISSNSAGYQGGGIFTEDYSYFNPVDTTKYSNLNIASAAIVSLNTADITEVKPNNYATFTNFDGNLLTNDQINYINMVGLTYDSNNGSGIKSSMEYHPYNTAITWKSAETLGFNPPQPWMELDYWSNKAGGIDDGGIKYPNPYNITDTITVYAIWKAQSGTISGYVFNDLNGNGVYDSSEGLANRNVKLYKKVNGVFVDTTLITTTDTDGLYKINVDVNEKYKIIVNIRDGNMDLIAKGSTLLSSNVDWNGYSDELEIGYIDNNARNKNVNAGYAVYSPSITGVTSNKPYELILLIISSCTVVGILAFKNYKKFSR
ncbi:hypothetical protein OKW23_000980 [Bacilli bacterium PM5-9]|nr:hypothetical protein [Bacilli bacterium PM5-9]